MAKSPAASAKPADMAAHYLTSVPLQSILPINVGLRSAQEGTMISVFGSPRMPLTTNDQPDRASPQVVALKQTGALSNNAKLTTVTGIRPALESARAVVEKAIAQEAAAGRDLQSVLATDGMLVVRYRHPTSGNPSTQISNHAWGTAVDFRIAGHEPPGNTHDMIPRFIAVLVPLFNAAGWYSGIGFSDTMHFEVSDGTIHDWAKAAQLNP